MIDIPFILCVVLAVPVVLFGDALRMAYGFRPDLAIIFVVALAFSGRGKVAPLFGFILGLLLDSLNHEAVFTYSIGYFLVGLAVTYVRARFLRQSLFVRCVSLVVLIQVFRIYLILAGAIHSGSLVTPSFHPGIIAPGLILSLLLFVPLTMILDRVLPIGYDSQSVRGVFFR